MGGHTNPQANKTNDAQAKSYTLLPPAVGVAAVGGGDAKNPKAYIAVWSTVTTGLEEVIREAAPWYFIARDQVENRVAEIKQELNGKPAAIKKKLQSCRLYMAEGALDAIYLRLQRFFQMSAARGNDEHYILKSNDPPFYQKWGTLKVYDLAIFRSQTFLTFVDNMKMAQDRESNYEINVSGQQRNEVERVVGNMVADPLNRHFAQSSQVVALQQQLLQQNELILAMLNERRGGDDSPAYVAAATSLRASLPPTEPMDVEAEVVEDDIPLLTRNGNPRQRAPRRNMAAILPCGKLWSSNLLTAKQFWQEFDEGIDGRIALRDMEDNFGPLWRSDALLAKNVPGSVKPGGSYKVEWSVRTAIYNYIVLRTEGNMTNRRAIPLHTAIDLVQGVFNRNTSLHGRPRLNIIAPKLRDMLKDLGVEKGQAPYPRHKRECPHSDRRIDLPEDVIGRYHRGEL